MKDFFIIIIILGFVWLWVFGIVFLGVISFAFAKHKPLQGQKHFKPGVQLTQQMMPLATTRVYRAG